MFLKMSQKVAWDSEKRVNINEFSEFIVAPWNRKILKTQCEMNFPALQNWQIILDSDWNEIFKVCHESFIDQGHLVRVAGK